MKNKNNSRAFKTCKKKKQFQTQPEAQKKCNKLYLKYDIMLRPYHCNVCDMFHIATIRRGDRGKQNLPKRKLSKTQQEKQLIGEILAAANK